MKCMYSSTATRFRNVATACMVTAGALWASTEELDLSMLFNLKVTTASKRAESVEDSPGIIATVTKYEIEQMGAKNLIDVLNQVPSLQMYNSSVFGVNKASFRGDAFSYTDNHTLILIDGRPCREGVRQGFDSPVYSMFPIDAIERIEVVRGPGSVLYGSTAMSGVINIITEQPGKENSLTIGASNEQDIYQRAKLSLANEESDKGILIANQLYLNQGKKYKADWALGPYEVDLQSSEIGIFSSMMIKDLKLTSFFGRTEYGSAGFLNQPTSSANNMQSRLFVNLDHKSQLSDKWEITTSGTWNYTDVELYATNDIGSGGLPEGAEDTIGLENASDFLVESYISGEVFKNFNVLWGGLVLNENKWDMPKPRPDDQAEITKVPNRYHNLFYSTYGQIDYKIADRVKVLAGFQVNKPKGQDVDVVPRVGVISDIYKGLGAKVLYGEAFRSPIAPEKLFVSQPDPTNVNTLEPEKIKTLDAQIFFAGNKGKASATYFRSQMSKVIGLEQDDAAPGWTNIDGDIVTNGVEVEGKLSPVEGLMLSGSWLNQVSKKTYKNEAGTEVTDSKVANAPQWMVKLGTTYTTPFALHAGVFMETYGKASMYGKTLLPTMSEPEVSTMLNANIGYTLPFEKKVTFNLAVKNILDDESFQPFLLLGGNASDYIRREFGRTLEATITTSF